MYNPIKTIKTNTIGTINMLGLAKRVKAKFLLASTSEVYGGKYREQGQSFPSLLVTRLCSTLAEFNSTTSWSILGRKFTLKFIWDIRIKMSGVIKLVRVPICLIETRVHSSSDALLWQRVKRWLIGQCTGLWTLMFNRASPPVAFSIDTPWESLNQKGLVNFCTPPILFRKQNTVQITVQPFSLNP